MTLKFYLNADTFVFDPQMFLDFNEKTYHITTNDKDNNIDINLCGHRFEHRFNNNVKSKIKLNLDIFYSHENLVKSTIEKINENNLYYIINQYDPNYQHERVFYNDFLFNRTKAYYTNFNFSQNTIKWAWYKNSYVLTDNLNPENKNKIFLSPSFSLRKIKYRPQIGQLLKPYHNILGYVSFKNGQNVNFLIPHKIFPKCKDINALESIQFRNYPAFSYSPPHILYYENTFISIFGEICEHGTGYTPSEKTYEPLIKGHFILPFSNRGYILYLKNIGFKFPNFIDYSYDHIKNNNQRFEIYKKEIERLLNISIDDWRQLWNDNLHIIKYNQDLFYSKPYDTIDLQKLL